MGHLSALGPRPVPCGETGDTRCPGEQGRGGAAGPHVRAAAGRRRAPPGESRSCIAGISPAAPQQVRWDESVLTRDPGRSGDGF